LSACLERVLADLGTVVGFGGARERFGDEEFVGAARGELAERGGREAADLRVGGLEKGAQFGFGVHIERVADFKRTRLQPLLLRDSWIVRSHRLVLRAGWWCSNRSG